MSFFSVFSDFLLSRDEIAEGYRKTLAKSPGATVCYVPTCKARGRSVSMFESRERKTKVRVISLFFKIKRH